MSMRLRAVAALVAACALLTATPAAAGPAHPQVVGGSPGTIAEHPWQVILLLGENALCSGALISSTWVLTAAHCIDGAGPSTTTVWSGLDAVSKRTSQNGTAVSEIIVHPGWNAQTYANDIALIRLATPFTPGPERRAISLPASVDAANWPTAGSVAVISGWGVLSFGGDSPDQLQQANVHVIASPGAPCGEYGSGFDSSIQLCAGELDGSIDTCQGDSGGPIVVVENGVPLLAGVTSIGNDCATPNYPGLYTRVTSFIPWIRQYADVPVAAPAPPAAVTATALAGGRLQVGWTPNPANGGADVTAFTATPAPDGTPCTVRGNGCVISGLTPGTSYTVSVVATNPAGASAPSAPSGQVMAVSGTARVGRSVGAATIRKWAGVRTGALRPTAKRICTLRGAKVAMLRTGVCTVRVGSRTAYIAVS